MPSRSVRTGTLKTTSQTIRALVWSVFLLVSLGPTIDAQTISSISGSNVTLDRGTRAGIAAGTRLYVIAYEEAAGRKVKIRVAKLLVETATELSAVARAIEIGAGYVLAPGLACEVIASAGGLTGNRRGHAVVPPGMSNDLEQANRRDDKLFEPTIEGKSKIPISFRIRGMSLIDMIHLAKKLVRDHEFEDAIAVYLAIKAIAPEPILYEEDFAEALRLRANHDSAILLADTSAVEQQRLNAMVASQSSYKVIPILPTAQARRTPPKLIRQTAPTFPSEALKNGIAGTVTISATVGVDGRIRNPEFVSGHPLFRQSAIDAISTWLYEPGTLNGAPIESTVSITLRFSLR